MTLPGSGEVTRLTLLSILSLGPLHGYGLREVMESWHMEAWADIRYGSIYQALRTMAKDGLVTEVDSVADGRRPPKTVYRITDGGREKLRELLRRAWGEPSRYVEPINVALNFVPLNLLDGTEIAELLERRLERLAELGANLKAQERQGLERSSDPGLQAAVSDHFGHFHRLVEADREWTIHVLGQVRRDAYRIGRNRTR